MPKCCILSILVIGFADYCGVFLGKSFSLVTQKMLRIFFYFFFLFCFWLESFEFSLQFVIFLVFLSKEILGGNFEYPENYKYYKEKDLF